MGVESPWERWQDLILGAIFLFLGIVASKRVVIGHAKGGGFDTVTTFYFLIATAAGLRAIWFFIPNDLLEPGYAPETVMAFQGSWIGTFASELLLAAGTLAVFSVFIHIVVNWSNLLKTVFRDSQGGASPMRSFLFMISFLAMLEIIIAVLFLLRVYTSQGMVLLDSALVTVVSLVCCIEISVFSHRFRNVLQTFGAINQVSTEAQMRLIVWITTTGNVFFVVRALCELVTGCILFVHWRTNKSLKVMFDSTYWDTYILVKHATEALVLYLMLWMPELKQQQSEEPPPPASHDRSEYARINEQEHNHYDVEGNYDYRSNKKRGRG